MYRNYLIIFQLLLTKCHQFIPHRGSYSDDSISYCEAGQKNARVVIAEGLPGQLRGAASNLLNEIFIDSTTHVYVFLTIFKPQKQVLLKILKLSKFNYLRKLL